MENTKFEIECAAIAKLFPNTDMEVIKAAWTSFTKSPAPKNKTAISWFTQCMAAESICHILKPKPITK